ncbi:MAG: hypothetical protein MJ252_15055 [archaeon]|nr:hypothetical protein [archaeon]
MSNRNKKRDYSSYQSVAEDIISKYLFYNQYKSRSDLIEVLKMEYENNFSQIEKGQSIYYLSIKYLDILLQMEEIDVSTDRQKDQLVYFCLILSLKFIARFDEESSDYYTSIINFYNDNLGSLMNYEKRCLALMNYDLCYYTAFDSLSKFQIECLRISTKEERISNKEIFYLAFKTLYIFSSDDYYSVSSPSYIAYSCLKYANEKRNNTLSPKFDSYMKEKFKRNSDTIDKIIKRIKGEKDNKESTIDTDSPISEMKTTEEKVEPNEHKIHPKLKELLNTPIKSKKEESSKKSKDKNKKSRNTTDIFNNKEDKFKSKENKKLTRVQIPLKGSTQVKNNESKIVEDKNKETQKMKKNYSIVSYRDSDINFNQKNKLKKEIPKRPINLRNVFLLNTSREKIGTIRIFDTKKNKDKEEENNKSMMMNYFTGIKMDEDNKKDMSTIEYKGKTKDLKRNTSKKKIKITLTVKKIPQPPSFKLKSKIKDLSFYGAINKK